MAMQLATYKPNGLGHQSSTSISVGLGWVARVEGGNHTAINGRHTGTVHLNLHTHVRKANGLILKRLVAVAVFCYWDIMEMIEGGRSLLEAVMVIIIFEYFIYTSVGLVY